eukprot:m.460135 g.460135  ORF g.460135 m.460135 type:complete len:511 (-) comp21943_c0_seq1:139-1671(-)
MRAQLTRRWECHVMTVSLVAVCLEIAPPIFALPTVSPAAAEVPTLTCGAHETDSVTLRWAAVPGATLYEVVVGAPGTSIEHSPYASVTATPAQASGLVVADLLDGHLYAFKLRAHVGFGGDQMVLGWGNYSNAVTCSTLSADPRAPRRLRRATDALAHDAFDLTWDPPASGAAAEATGGYSVKVREVTKAAVTDWRVVSTHKFASQDRVSRVTGLMPGRTYEAIVVAEYAKIKAHASTAAVFRTANDSTIWINPHRVSENLLTTVDFLANHNSGTLQGDVGFMTFAGNSSHFFNLFGSPLTSFCVEMAKVDLSGLNRTSSNPPSIPTDNQFADYISCNGNRDDPPNGWGNYTCVCDNTIDRVIAHQPAAFIEKLCGDGPIMPEKLCTCGAESLAASARYTGFMATSLPWIHMHRGPSGSPIPDPPATITPFGGWYSHPSGTKCADTTGQVGDGGCTWRRDPRARMVYGAGLVAAGWVIPQNATTADILGNVKAATKAFNAIPMTPRCCGC